jgi:hypothetical protein
LVFFSSVMSLRTLPGRGVRHRYHHHHRDPQDDSSTTAASSYESKRIEIVKAVQASLKELYAAGYTRSRATGAIVRLLQRQVGGGSPLSVLLSSSGTAHVAAGRSPSEAELVRIMRHHQMTDGSAMHVLVVSKWIEQRATKYQTEERRSRSQNQSQEGAVLRAMDDLVRVVRGAPRTILSSIHSPAQKPGSVSRAPKEAAAAPVRASVLSPTKPAPDGGAPTKHVPLSASAVASATRSISTNTSTKLDGTTNRRRKSVRAAAAGRSSSPALVATASTPRGRSDSDVEAERTVSSKVLSGHPRAGAAAESSSSSAAVATGAAVGTIASPAGSRKRSRSSSGDEADSPTSAKAPLPSPAPPSRSSVSCANGGGGGGGKRTRTRR